MEGLGEGVEEEATKVAHLTPDGYGTTPGKPLDWNRSNTPLGIIRNSEPPAP